MEKRIKSDLMIEIIAKGGGVRRLASKLKISPQAVSRWTRVPVERLADVERITKIDRAVLRPDIFDR